MATTPLLIGSYTSGTGSPGVVRAYLDDETGDLVAGGAPVELVDPSWVAMAPDTRTLYAVGEHADGTVASVPASGDGPPTVRSGAGDDPCHLTVHRGHLLVAGYGSGTVAVFALDDAGVVGERTHLVRHSGCGPDDRQRSPHVHQVREAPDGRFVLVTDLGTDTVTTYRLAGGRLAAVSATAAPAGSGPRHLTFHPSGRAAVLVLELAGAVALCRYDPVLGRLDIGPVVPLGVPGLPSEAAITADGHHAYVGVRDDDGHGWDGVVHLGLAVAGSAARVLGHHETGGEVPRHLVVTADQRWLLTAHQRSGTVCSVPLHEGVPGGAVSRLDAPGASCLVL